MGQHHPDSPAPPDSPGPPENPAPPGSPARPGSPGGPRRRRGGAGPDDPGFPARTAPDAPTLDRLDAAVTDCRACPRLVEWRERV
ncbi:hypothetical protein AB0N23_29795, partial [Streptomyces sp. NPDC052644]